MPWIIKDCKSFGVIEQVEPVKLLSLCLKLEFLPTSDITFTERTIRTLKRRFQGCALLKFHTMSNRYNGMAVELNAFCINLFVECLHWILNQEKILKSLYNNGFTLNATLNVPKRTNESKLALLQFGHNINIPLYSDHIDFAELNRQLCGLEVEKGMPLVHGITRVHYLSVAT